MYYYDQQKTGRNNNLRKKYRRPKPKPRKAFVNKFLITSVAYEKIKATVGFYAAETGGLLLGDAATGLIIDFVFDESAKTTSSIYHPSVDFLNAEIEKHEALGIKPLGIAHSHPPKITLPSAPDLHAAYNNITSPHNDHLQTWHLPIIQSAADNHGQFALYPYIVSCGSGLGDTVLHTPVLEIINDEELVSKKCRYYLGNQIDLPTTVPEKHISKTTVARLNNHYKRESSHVDFSKMLKTSIIHVGLGASSTGVEQLARLGIKRWVFFDPDYVEPKNLVAQNFSHADVGKLKTQATKDRLEACEFEPDSDDVPTLKIDTHGDFLAIDDVQLDALIESEKRDYDRVILVAATDYHPAQARVNRIALKHCLSAFFMGAYRGGLAGEIAFFPGDLDRNLPCYRCITKSRYSAFDNKPSREKKASATSSGLPFAISILDGQLSHLIIGCIHHADSKTNPHAAFFQELVHEQRNFIQTQLNPHYRMAGEDIFRDDDGVHGRNVKTFISMFQADKKDTHCPDCGPSACWTSTDYRKERSD